MSTSKSELGRRLSARHGMRAVGAVLCAACWTSGVACASAGSLSDSDIMRLLAIANMSDIASGRLAAEKGSSPSVREYGKRMVDDHRALHKQGQGLSLEVPMSPQVPEIAQRLTKDHEQAVQELSAQSGKGFDEAYVGHEIHMHQQVLSMVDDALKTSQAPQVKGLLSKARPALESHLAEAERLKRELGAGGSQ